MATTAMKFQVPIEMSDVALASKTSAQIWEQTKVNFDTGDYDGNPVYEFEIVYNNFNAATTYTVTLVNGAGTIIATINIAGGNTGTPIRARTSFTPTSGADTYRVQTSLTSSADHVEVYTARIIVTQDTTTTKTRVQIPLANHKADLPGTSVTSTIDTFTSAGFAQPNQDHYTIMLLELSKLTTIAVTNPYTLELSWKMSDATSQIKGALFDTSNSNEVANSEATLTNTSTQTTTVVNWSSDTNWIDTHQYELRLKRVSGAATGNIDKACLYIRLTSLTKALAYWRNVKTIEATAGFDAPHQRAIYDSSKYQNPTLVWDATIRAQTPGTNSLEMIDSLTQDQGTSNASSISTISNPGSTKTRTRNTGISITSGHRYYQKVNVTSGEVDAINGILVVSSSATFTDNSTTALRTTLETSGNKSTAALRTTLEVIPQKSTVAAKTTLSKPGSVTLALKTMLEKVVTVSNRRNLFPNPSFEVDVFGWGMDGEYTRDSTDAFIGTSSIKQVSASGFENFTTFNDSASRIAVTPGKNYVLGVYYKLTLNSGFGENIEIHDDQPFAGNVIVFDSFGAAAIWTRKVISFTGPASGFITWRQYTNNSDIVAFYDAFSLEEIDQVLPYFDGNYQGSWTGTPNASISTQPMNRIGLKTITEAPARTLALRTNLEVFAAKKTLAVAARLETIPQKVTIAVKTTLQSPLIKVTLASLATLIRPDLQVIAIRTSLETFAAKKTLAAKTTLESLIQKSTVAIKTTLELTAYQGRPVGMLLGITYSIAGRTVPLQTTLEATVPKYQALEQENLINDTSASFGQFNGVRYRGYGFIPTRNGFVKRLAISRNLGPSGKGLKFYFDNADSNFFPNHAVGSELYSFTITNAQLTGGYQIFTLPTPLYVVAGQNYCWYLAPWDTTNDVYSNDLANEQFASGGNGITSEITNTNGIWSNEALTPVHSLWMQTATEVALSALLFQPTAVVTLALKTLLEVIIQRSTLALKTTVEAAIKRTIALKTDFLVITKSTLALKATLEATSQITPTTLALKVTLEAKKPAAPQVGPTTNIATLTTFERGNQSLVGSLIGALAVTYAFGGYTIALLTSLNTTQNNTFALKTTLQTAGTKSTISINTRLETPLKISPVALKTLLESLVQRATLATRTALETNSIKSTIALLSTFEKPTGYSTLATKTTLEQNNRLMAGSIMGALAMTYAFGGYTIALNTILVLSGVSSTLALKTTLERVGVISTVALRTLLETIILRSTVALKTTLQSAVQTSSLAVKTTFESITNRTVALKTTLEAAIQKTTIALTTTLEHGVVSSTTAIKTTFESAIQKPTIALKTNLEKVLNQSPVALLVTFEVIPQKSTIGLSTTLEHSVIKTTISIQTRLEKVSTRTIALVTRMEATKESPLAIATLLATIFQFSTLGLNTDLSVPAHSTLGLNTNLEKTTRRTLAMTSRLLHFIGWHNDDYGHLGYQGQATDLEQTPRGGVVIDGSQW